MAAVFLVIIVLLFTDNFYLDPALSMIITLKWHHLVLYKLRVENLFTKFRKVTEKALHKYVGEPFP